MQADRIVSKAGTVASLPMCLLLVVFFFLPWLNVSCMGHHVADASGLQISIGKVGLDPRLSEADKPRSSSSRSPGSTGTGEDPKARPWFFLALVIPVILLASGVMDLTGRLSGSTGNRALLALGLAGFLVLLMALGVDYGAEMADRMRAAAADPARGAKNPMLGLEMSRDMGGTVRTTPTGILIFSIVLQGLVACCGLVNQFLPRFLAMSAQGQYPPPAPPDRPPGSL